MGDQELFWTLNISACTTVLVLHVLRSRLTVGPSIAWAGLTVFLVWGLTETGWWVMHGPFRFNGALMALVPSILCGMAQVYALDGVRIARTYFVVCLLSAAMAILFLEFRLALATSTPGAVFIRSSIESQIGLAGALAGALAAVAFASEAGKRVGDRFALAIGAVGGTVVFAVAYSFLSFGAEYGVVNLKNEFGEYAACALPAIFAQGLYGYYAAHNHIVMPARRFSDVAVAWNNAEREAETAKRDALEAKERIVELQELTRALRGERQRRQHQTAGSPLAIVDIGPDLRIAQANAAATALLSRATGSEPIDIVGRDAETLFPGFRSAANARVGKAAFDVRGPVGTRRVELALLPVETGGHFGGFSTILEDVTETEQARKRERTAMRIRDLHRTAGAITHDFSNLFTAIEAHASLISKATFAEARNLSTSTTAISSAVVRGRAMLAQLGAGQSFARPELVAVDVAQLVGETFSIHRAAANFARIELVDDVGPGHLIQADSHQVARVLVNLVGNSIRATAPGGKIVVAASRVGPGIEIAVRDTGCGMSQSQIRSAFDPAFSTKGDGAGGLGLAVSYLIVDAHGGRIDIESTAGEGTVVRLWLPAVEAPTATTVAAPVVVLLPDGNVKDEICRRLSESGVDFLELATPEELTLVDGDIDLGGAIIVFAAGVEGVPRWLHEKMSLRTLEIGPGGKLVTEPIGSACPDGQYAMVAAIVSASLETPTPASPILEASA